MLYLSIQQTWTQQKWETVILFCYNRKCETKTSCSPKINLEMPWAVLSCIYMILSKRRIPIKVGEEGVIEYMYPVIRNGRKGLLCIHGGKKSKLFWSATVSLLFDVIRKAKCCISCCSGMTQSQRSDLQIFYVLLGELTVSKVN